MTGQFIDAALVLTVVVICFGSHSAFGQEFGYDGHIGPEHWGKQYVTCDGKYQSPINIQVLDVVPKRFPELNMNGFYETPESAELVNNGHTVVAKLKFKHDIPTISGGSLKANETFRFSQFHFHWGDNDTLGSEDRINNVSFPAELHMVFYNEKYETLQGALGHNGAIAVLAFFYSIQDVVNINYVELATLLEEVREPNMHVAFGNPPHLASLISIDLTNYYTYIGSLTTPPCSEDVTWLDFDYPIIISTEQIELFRRLNTHDGVPLTHNFRPIQPLNNRTIYQAMSMESPMIRPSIHLISSGSSNRRRTTESVYLVLANLIAAYFIVNIRSS